jgi:16S rRNA G966 N2-methylase RsmD
VNDIAWIRSSGFLPEPEDKNIIFSRLSRARIYNGHLPQSSIGTKYLDNIFEHRFDAKTSGFPSFREAFNDDYQINRVLHYLSQNGKEPTCDLILRNLHYNIRTPSHFFPESASALCNEYGSGRKIYDVFTGWGGRALGALCANASHLISTDTQLLSIKSGKRLSSDFSNLSKTESEFINCDFKQYISTTGAEFDFIIASPPFLWTEEYSESKVGSIRSWINSILHPLVEGVRRVLKPNGKIAIHGQDRPSVPVLSLIYTAFSCAGFLLDREMKYGKKPGQSILIFMNNH